MNEKNKHMTELFIVSACVLSAGLLLRISYDAAIMFSAVCALAVGIVFRPHRLRGWIPAFIITLIWIAASGNMYAGYNTFHLYVFGIALFPILAWPVGLMLGYYYALPRIMLYPWQLRWIVLSVIYSVGLILFEIIGYHVLGIHLDAGKAYPGWPYLRIFHCPVWMQVAYFLNGIVFMGISSWMDRNDVVTERVAKQ